MEALAFVAAVLVLIVGYFVYVKVTNLISSGVQGVMSSANRAVQRDKHAAGLKELDTTYVYATHADVVALYLAMADIPIHTDGGLPRTTKVLYRSTAQPPRLIGWTYGARSTVSTSWTAMAAINDEGVYFRIVDAAAPNGVILDVDKMTELRQAVHEAIRTVDPAVTETVTSDTAR